MRIVFSRGSAAWLGGLIAATILFFSSAQARAQGCCSGTGDTCHKVAAWPACTAAGCVQLDAAPAATGSAPTPDTGFNPSGLGGFATSHSFAITGKKLVGINNTNGSQLFSTTVNNATLDNFANPVILTADCVGANCANSTKITNFIAGDDGFLYKIVYDTSNSMITSTWVNLQRPGCTLDKLKGTPAVQLTRFSNSTFQTAMGDSVTDLVIVGTYYTDQGGTCPGGQNRVYGLRSSNLSTKWVYNQTGSLVLNEVTEACPVEYYSSIGNPAGTSNNMVVCGFNKTGSTNGMVALNTATTLATGSARWAVDTVGGVIVRPVIATLNGRRTIYVGTSDAYVRAYSPVNGSLFWTGGSALVQNGIAQNLWAEFRGGVLANRIFVLASDGTFRRFIDNGTFGIEEGTGLTADATGTVKYTSMVVAAPGGGVDSLYLGRNDGKVQQISSSYTQQETQIVGGNTATVFDPALDIAPDGTVTHLVVTAGSSGATPGKIVRLVLPWCSNPAGSGGTTCVLADASCNGYLNATQNRQYDACAPRSCDSQKCQNTPTVADGTPCDDASNCSFSYPSSGGCPSNKCVGGSNNGSNCSSDGQCPGGTCFMNRCLGGPTPGAGCTNNNSCIGSGVRGNCKKVLLGVTAQTLCDSGGENGNHCLLRCVGGSQEGFPCVTNADCFDGLAGTCPDVNLSTDCPPAGRCVKWRDGGDGTCVATQSNPFCNTIADCPTTRYCANDPKNLLGGPAVCTTNWEGLPAPTLNTDGLDSIDECCSGGVTLGPCLVYDQCVSNVCTRTTQGNRTIASVYPGSACAGSGTLMYGESGCAGGPQGAGGTIGKTCTTDAQCPGAKCISGRCTGTCNNACKSGRCVSNSYANCSCESAGDRACGAGQTCCGAQGTCKRFGDTCASNTDCCSNLCRNTKCDQPALTCKRFATPCSSNPECCSGVCTSGTCTAVAPGVNCYDLTSNQHHCGSCDTDCGLYPCLNGECQGPTGSACTDVPSTAQILAAGAGADSISFEHTNLNGLPSGQKCAAWMARSNGTGTAGSMVRVGSSSTQTFNTATSMLLGIAPACQGDDATSFACGANAAEIVLATFPSSTSTPIARFTSGAINADAAMTAPTATSGSGPFIVSNYNNGPVGPAFDWKTYDGSTNRTAYWGNWNANGDVKKVTGGTWTVSTVTTTPAIFPERVNAIAFGRRDYYWKSTSNGSQLKKKANSLYIGHGAKLTILNIDTPPAGYMVNAQDPTQIDIDLAQACEATSCSLRCEGGSHNQTVCTSPTDANCTGFGGSCSGGMFCFGPHGGKSCSSINDCHGCGPEAPTGIQSIAPHATQDAVYLVVKGTNDTFVIEVRPRPRGARAAREAQDEMAQSDNNGCPNGNGDNPMDCMGCAPTYSCIPTTVNTMDAKIAFDPFGNLVWIGLGNTLGSALQSVQSYTATNK